MSNARMEWLRERKTYLGGSDVGCILGLSPYKTPLDIFLEKTSEDVEETTSEAAYWGMALEDILAKEYAKRTGHRVTKAKGVIRHPEHSFLGANIDRWVDDERFILECKTASFLKGPEWGAEGSNQIPELYLCQVAYYAAICGVSKVDLVVLIGGQDFRLYTYHQNEALETKLLRAAKAFWQNYILKGLAPSARDAHDLARLYPCSNGATITASWEVEEAIRELKSLKQQERQIGERKIALEHQIKSWLAENEVLAGSDGQILATWKSSRVGQTLDTSKLKQEQLALYQQYLVERQPSRPFLVK